MKLPRWWSACLFIATHIFLLQVWDQWRRGSVAEVVDASPGAGGQYAGTEAQALSCVQIGLLCVQKDPRSRPDASEVVLMLEGRCAIQQKPSRPAFYSGHISVASARRAARGSAVSYGRLSAIGSVSENGVTVSELDPR